MERGETLDELQWINLFSDDLNTIFSASKLLADSYILQMEIGRYKCKRVDCDTW